MKRVTWLAAMLLGAGLVFAYPPTVGAAGNAEGTKLLKEKKYEDAEAVFRKALEKSPDDISLMEGLAQALEGEKKYGEASAMYEHMADEVGKKAGAGGAGTQAATTRGKD